MIRNVLTDIAHPLHYIATETPKRFGQLRWPLAPGRQGLYRRFSPSCVAADALSSFGLPAEEGPNWYLGKLDLPEGFAQAEAKIQGYSKQTSVWKPLIPGRPTLYFLVLRPRQPVQRGRLTVSVFEEGKEDIKYVTQARVEFARDRRSFILPSNEGVLGPETLPAGKWWVRVLAEGYISSRPQAMPGALPAAFPLWGVACQR